MQMVRHYDEGQTACMGSSLLLTQEINQYSGAAK